MSTLDLSAHLRDPARLAALRAVALLDTPTEEAFDRLSRLAARFVNAPVALVSLVDADRQFFKSCIGLPEPWRSRRETPLSHSFCQHNRVAGQPLLIEDARTHPLVKDNLAIRELNVIAYLGIPLVTSDGYVLGSFCVIDSKPRRWSEEEVSVIQDLAAAVMTEIQLRTESAARTQAETERDNLTELNTLLRSEIAAREEAEEQQRQLEAQLHQAQKMEALGQLAGGIAHEFNNMLTAILGFTQLAIADAPPTSSVSQHLQAVETASNRATELTQQILAFSHPSSETRRPLDLEAIVDETLQLLRASLPTTIEIRQQISPEPGRVQANATQLQQMLMNLCVNAEYAMRETGGLLEIRVEPVEIGVDVADHPLQLAPGAYVRLIVRDTGCGMVPDVMGRIFEPFFTTKGIGEGTGIGLSIVHGIATSYGGAVTAESRPGEGSAFAIYLPRFESPTAIETSEVAEVLPQGPSCILYVDDEALLARLGQEMLASMGYEVVATTSSAEALERFRAMPERFDLVITDQTMPSLTGENLARELRRIRADIPIILCTGFSHVIDAQKAQAMGINAFCMKPLDRGKFTRVIERVLGRR